MDKPLSVFPKGAGSMTAEKTSGRQMSDTFRAAAFIILSRRIPGRVHILLPRRGLRERPDR